MRRRRTLPGTRVETLTRKYDSRVMITEFIEAKVRHLIEQGALYRVDMKEIGTVKGKDIPVKILGIATLQNALSWL